MDHFPGHKGCLHTLHPGNEVNQHLLTRTEKRAYFAVIVTLGSLLFVSRAKWQGTIPKWCSRWHSARLCWWRDASSRHGNLGCALFNAKLSCQLAKRQRWGKVTTSHKSWRENFHGRKFKWWGMCSMGANTFCALPAISGLWDFLVGKWMNFSAVRLMVK